MTDTERMAIRLQVGATIPSKVMLAHEFNPKEYGDCTQHVSFKHDGLRAIYMPRLGFFTREGIPFSEELTKHIDISIHNDYILDGEFYSHGLSLQEINGAMGVNRSLPNDLTPMIKFHLFDIIIPHMTTEERIRTINYAHSCSKFPQNVVIVEHRLCNCWLQLHATFQGAVGAGYEGVMIRTGTYENKRSRNLLKWKANETVDAVVKNFTEGIGKFAGMLGSMELALEDGVRFSCGSGWTDEERQQIWHNRVAYIDKQARIKYLNKSRDGVPKMSTFLRWLS